VPLGRPARRLRVLHTAVGLAEMLCLSYLWSCALRRRRTRLLRLSVGVLAAEGLALVTWDGCPLGALQRRAGDDVPMFELWFGTRLARFAVPTFGAVAVAGAAVALARPPMLLGGHERRRAG
jgi:hypothetical protein